MEGAASAETPPTTSPRGGSRTVRDGFGLNERGGNSSGRGRGQNRGRGKSSRGRDTQRGHAQRTGITRPELGAPHGKAGDSQPAAAQTKESDAMASAANGEDEVEADICFICASNVVHNAIAPCNHRTCHICALRLRALYKTKACAHCRTNSDFVIFTDDGTKRYEDFSDRDFTRSDDVLGIKYEKGEIFEDTVLLLRYNCPDPTCDIACYGWPDLHRHVKSVHHKVMCDLCTRNKKVFTHEHELFTNAELRKHEKSGDDNPGAVDQSGFRGHPECGFCRQRFYGDDELYTHCRDKHERCHICDRTSTGTQRQYYLDYNALEVHFGKDHFLCADRECLEKKFVVFESEMDLKGHQLEAHPHGLSKDARRDARRVDMTGFDIRGSQRDQQQQGNRREGRGRGRGRDPNMEPVPASTAQPMRRDELAYQRQLAIHSAQSLAPRSFGGQLTSGGAYTARPTSGTSEPATVTAPSSGSRTVNNSQPPPVENSIPVDPEASATLNQSMTPGERARALRHTSLTERTSNLLQHDQAKLQDFRTKVSSYKNSVITASVLVDNFFVLFDCTSAELGKLVKELADIFEIQTKKDDLLKAWNDWRAINEDYPSLPGPDGLPVTGTSSGGKRILKLKSATAQSNRTAQKPGGWGAVAGSLNSRGVNAANAFPQLPSVSSSSKSGLRPAWLASSSNPTASSQPQTPTRSTTSTSTSRTKPPASNNPDLFPALPTAQKPSMTALRPGYAGSLVKRDTGSGGKNTPVNAWDRSNNIADFDGNLSRALEAASLDANAAGGAAEESGGMKSKSKGKKKQTLIHWG